MGIIEFAINCAWKVLILSLSVYLFVYIVRNGRQGIRDLFHTVEQLIRGGCALARRKLIQKLEAETSHTEEPDQDGEVKVEGTVV